MRIKKDCFLVFLFLTQTQLIFWKKSHSEGSKYLQKAVKNGSKPNQDHKEPPKSIGQIWKDRRRECAAVLYRAMDIAWDDKEARNAAAFRNFELFDAPHVAFLCMDEAFGLSRAWDVGMYAQTLMLAMTANGLASCAQGTMGHHPDLVREAFGLGPEVKVLFGLSFGYEDTSMKVNNAHTERALLEDTVTFKSWPNGYFLPILFP